MSDRFTPESVYLPNEVYYSISEQHHPVRTVRYKRICEARFLSVLLKKQVFSECYVALLSDWFPTFRNIVRPSRPSTLVLRSTVRSNPQKHVAPQVNTPYRTRVKSLLSAIPPPPEYSSDLHKPGSSPLLINVPLEATRNYPHKLQH